MNEEYWENVKLIISIISIIVTSIFSIVTIIVTCYNANKQIKQSEKTRKQQEEQYNKESQYNKELIRIQKRPYLVIDKCSHCIGNGNNNYHIIICFKNKGNGSAFKIEPVTQITTSNGNTILQEEPIQDPIVMVNELCDTYWKFNSPELDFQFSITVKFEDMSAQLYQQTFILTLNSKLNIIVTNYTEPELLKG